jgi:hypothetical protein
MCQKQSTTRTSKRVSAQLSHPSSILFECAECVKVHVSFLLPTIFNHPRSGCIESFMPAAGVFERFSSES